VRDLSINLPSWACREGYRLEGSCGTFGELYLLKDDKVVKYWSCSERSPSIFEMEELLNEIESQKAE
jgi:hypothetical protein